MLYTVINCVWAEAVVYLGRYGADFYPGEKQGFRVKDTCHPKGTPQFLPYAPPAFNNQPQATGYAVAWAKRYALIR